MDHVAWTYVWMGVELPLVLFHMSVLTCVCRSMWKRSIHGGFFKAYVVQSIAELLMYCLVRTYVKILNVNERPQNRPS